MALLTFLAKHMLFKWQKLVLLLIPAVEYLGLTVQNSVCSEFANFCDTVPGAAKKLKTPENQAHEEMARFKETAPMPITKGANPLNWWKEHECEYPLLSNLAKRYLCIPRTSVSSERVCSMATDIITAQRSALTPEHLDQILFLHKNLKTKEVKYKY